MDVPCFLSCAHVSLCRCSGHFDVVDADIGRLAEWWPHRPGLVLSTANFDDGKRKYDVSRVVMFSLNGRGMLTTASVLGEINEIQQQGR